MGSGFWKVFAVLYSAGFTVATMFSTIWHDFKAMIMCGACTGSVTTFLKSLGSLFFTPQELVKTGTQMLASGAAPEYASFHWNQIFIGSIITIFFIVLIYNLYSWAVSPASMNALVALLVILGVILTFWGVQLAYTHFVVGETEWVPFPGWVELAKTYGDLPDPNDAAVAIPVLNDNGTVLGDAQVIL